jgi:hypothetical protein
VGHFGQFFVQLAWGERRREGQRRVGVTPHEEREPFLDQDRTDRRRRGVIVAENGEGVSSIGGGSFRQPAFGGGVCTVLCGLALLGDEELRRQRNDFRLMGSHAHRGQPTRGIGSGSVALGLPRTRGARDFLRGALRCAIHHHHHHQPLLPRPNHGELLGLA